MRNVHLKVAISISSIFEVQTLWLLPIISCKVLNWSSEQEKYQCIPSRNIITVPKSLSLIKGNKDNHSRDNHLMFIIVNREILLQNTSEFKQNEKIRVRIIRQSLADSWYKFNAMKECDEQWFWAVGSISVLLPRTNKVSQEEAEVRIRSITRPRWSQQISFLSSGQAGNLKPCQPQGKNRWGQTIENLILLFYIVVL